MFSGHDLGGRATQVELPPHPPVGALRRSDESLRLLATTHRLAADPQSQVQVEPQSQLRQLYMGDFELIGGVDSLSVGDHSNRRLGFPKNCRPIDPSPEGTSPPMPETDSRV